MALKWKPKFGKMNHMPFWDVTSAMILPMIGLYVPGLECEDQTCQVDRTELRKKLRDTDQ